MPALKSFVAAPVVALLLGGTAHAALTAEGVWTSWQEAGAAAGLQVTAATQNTTDGVLTLNGVSVAWNGSPAVTISDLVLTEQSDGSVTVQPGADVDLTLPGLMAGSGIVAHDGLTLTLRETADGEIAYDIQAAKLDLALNMEMADGAEIGTPEQENLTYGLENLSATYVTTPGTNRVASLDLKAEKVNTTIELLDPAVSSKMTATNAGTGAELSVDVTLPTTISLLEIDTPTEFATAVNEGFSISFASKQGESQGTMVEESPYMGFDLRIKFGAADSMLFFSKDKFESRTTTTSFEVESASEGMEGFKASTGPIEIGVLSPVIATTPADYGLVVKLNQLSLSDEAWALFDPAGALQRGAADLTIDLSGKVAMDLLTVMQPVDSDVIPPAPVLDSLNINEISAKVAGAAMNAMGAFTFDNTTGEPLPTGEVNVLVTGANALINGLVDAGLMQQEDVMGAMMMMGMFMVPGENPDELTSKIEAKGDWNILVNGQPLPM